MRSFLYKFLRMENLFAELMLEIIGNLNLENLKNLALVNYRWSEIVQAHFYRKYFYDYGELITYRYNIFSLYYCRKQNLIDKKLCRKIEHLIYVDGSLKNISYFSNLKTVIIDKYDKDMLYIGKKHIDFSLLPKTVTEVILRGYEGSIDDLPDSVVKLKTGQLFNKIIKKLPANLEYLEFGENYDRPILPGVLPNKLLKIKFGYYYNQPLQENIFPESVTSIKFGACFSQEINYNCLPKNLKKLDMGALNNKILNIKSTKIIKLKLSMHFNFPNIEECIPKTLKKITFGNGFKQNLTEKSLPAGLESIYFGMSYNQQINFSLPKNLKYITFGFYYDRPFCIDFFPETLIKIELPHKYPYHLPEKLEQKMVLY